MLWLGLVGCGWLGSGSGDLDEVTPDRERPEQERERGGKRGKGRRGGGPGGDRFADEMERVSLQVGGHERSAFVHVPDAVRGGQKVPMVVMFHGGHGDGTSAARLWLDQFDEPYILVFPNGQDWKPEWSGWAPTDGDVAQHVKFVDALLDQLVRDYPVDPKRIYAAGFSDGAQMTFRLACMLDQRFAGFAMVAQTMKDDTVAACAPKTEKPILYITGTADPKNPADGRAAPEDDKVGRIGIEDTLRYWLDHNRCDAKKERDKDLPDLRGDATRVRERLFDSCKGAPLKFLVVEGGGHSWPSDQQKGGDHCSDISATDEVLGWWREQAGFGG
ncbi:MAG: PHB depolymerase family esterase [Myxococcota bacterium]